MAGYPVRVEIFQGPLDLLLHLVRIHALDITDIPIVEITRQYEEYLDLMRQLNLEVAAEFLLMAATLVYIKSRVLLPAEPILEEGDEQGDPREELTRLLLEHQRLREAVDQLREKEISQAGVSFRPGSAVADFGEEYSLKVDLFDLLSAFRKILEEQEESRAVDEVPREPFPLEKAMEWILARIATGEKTGLKNLFQELGTRYERIAIFLGILELIRLGTLGAYQAQAGGEIFLRHRGGRSQRRWTPKIVAPGERKEDSLGKE